MILAYPNIPTSPPKPRISLACDMGGTSREVSMAGSLIGIRFLGPETIPCLVPFPDQMQPTREGARERFLEWQPVNTGFIDISLLHLPQIVTTYLQSVQACLY